jgi:hypothetical protein
MTVETPHFRYMQLHTSPVARPRGDRHHYVLPIQFPTSLPPRIEDNETANFGAIRYWGGLPCQA